MEEVEYLEEYEDVVLTQPLEGNPNGLQSINNSDAGTSMMYNSFYFEDSALGGEEIVEDITPFQMEYNLFQDTLKPDFNNSVDEDQNSTDVMKTTEAVNQKDHDFTAEHSYNSANRTDPPKRKPKKRRVRNVDAVTSDEEPSNSDQKKGVLLQDRESLKENENKRDNKPKVRRSRKKIIGIRKRSITRRPISDSDIEVALGPISKSRVMPDYTPKHTFTSDEKRKSNLKNVKRIHQYDNNLKTKSAQKSLTSYRTSNQNTKASNSNIRRRATIHTVTQNLDKTKASNSNHTLNKRPVKNQTITQNLNKNQGKDAVLTLQRNMNDVRGDNKKISIHERFPKVAKDASPAKSILMRRPSMPNTYRQHKNDDTHFKKDQSKKKLSFSDTEEDDFLHRPETRFLSQKTGSQGSATKRMIRKFRSTPNLADSSSLSQNIRDPLTIEKSENSDDDDDEKVSPPVKMRRTKTLTNRKIRENLETSGPAGRRVTFAMRKSLNPSPLPQNKRHLMTFDRKNALSDCSLQKRRSVLPSRYKSLKDGGYKFSLPNTPMIARNTSSSCSRQSQGSLSQKISAASTSTKASSADLKSVSQKNEGPVNSPKHNIIADASTLNAKSSLSRKYIGYIGKKKRKYVKQDAGYWNTYAERYKGSNNSIKETTTIAASIATAYSLSEKNRGKMPHITRSPAGLKSVSKQNAELVDSIKEQTTSSLGAESSSLTQNILGKRTSTKLSPAYLKSVTQKNEGSVNSVKQSTIAASTLGEESSSLSQKVLGRRTSTKRSPADLKSVSQKNEGSGDSIKENTIAASTLGAESPSLPQKILGKRTSTKLSPPDLKSVSQKNEASVDSINEETIAASTLETGPPSLSPQISGKRMYPKRSPGGVKSLSKKNEGSVNSVKQNTIASLTLGTESSDLDRQNLTQESSLQESNVNEDGHKNKCEIVKNVQRVRKRPRIIKAAPKSIADKFKHSKIRKVKVRIKKYEVQKIFAKSKKLYPKETSKFKARIGGVPSSETKKKEAVSTETSPRGNETPPVQTNTIRKSPRKPDAQKKTLENTSQVGIATGGLSSKAASKEENQQTQVSSQDSAQKQVPPLRAYSKTASKILQDQLRTAVLNNYPGETNDKQQSEIAPTQSCNTPADPNSFESLLMRMSSKNIGTRVTLGHPKQQIDGKITVSTPFAKGQERETLPEKPPIIVKKFTGKIHAIHDEKQITPTEPKSNVLVEVGRTDTPRKLLKISNQVVIKRLQKKQAEQAGNVVLSNPSKHDVPVIVGSSIPSHVVVETKLLTREEYLRKNLSRVKLAAAAAPSTTVAAPSSKVSTSSTVAAHSLKASTSSTVAAPSLKVNISSTVAAPSSKVNKTPIPLSATRPTPSNPATAVPDKDAIKKVFEQIQRLIDEEVSREVTRKLQQISEGFTTGKIKAQRPRLKKISSTCDLLTANAIHAVLKEYFTLQPEENNANSVPVSEKPDDENCILPDSERTPEDSDLSMPQDTPVAPPNTQSTPIIQNRMPNKRKFVKSQNYRQISGIYYTSGLKRVATYSRNSKRGRNKSPDYFRFRKIHLPGKHHQTKHEGPPDTQSNVATDHTYSSSPPSREGLQIVSVTGGIDVSSAQTLPSTSVNNQQNTDTLVTNVSLSNSLQSNESILAEENTSANISQTIITTGGTQSPHNVQIPIRSLVSSNKRTSINNSEELIVPDDVGEREESEEDEQSANINDVSTVTPAVNASAATSTTTSVNGDPDYEVVVMRHLKKVLIPTTGELSNSTDLVISDLILPDEPNISNVPSVTSPPETPCASKTPRAGIFIIADTAPRSGVTDPSYVDPQYTEEYSLDTGYQFKCEKCPVMLSSRPLIQDHVQRIHFKSSKNCYLCGIQLDQPHLLQHFLESHSAASISR